MTDWRRWRAANGFVGWLVMAAGALIVLIGLVGLIVGADPSPTAAAVLAGATLIGVGATLTGEDRPAAGLEGGLWRAIEGQTRTEAALAAGRFPEHLRSLLIDLAQGNAASQYIEIARSLRNQLAAGGVGAAGNVDPVKVMVGAVREMTRTSVQEASEAVAALEADVRRASDAASAETATMPPAPGFFDGEANT